MLPDIQSHYWQLEHTFKMLSDEKGVFIEEERKEEEEEEEEELRGKKRKPETDQIDWKPKHEMKYRYFRLLYERRKTATEES